LTHKNAPMVSLMLKTSHNVICVVAGDTAESCPSHSIFTANFGPKNEQKKDHNSFGVLAGNTFFHADQSPGWSFPK
jgi:hypothetical protein